MEWIEVKIDAHIKGGEYIVKTKTLFGWNVLKATCKVDDKGKLHWSCHNQLVIHILV